MPISRTTCFLASVTIMLGGCVSQPSTLPPVQESSDRAPIERTQPALPDETTPAQAPERTQVATNSLIASAEQASDNQDHTTAIVFLERAIRITPRDAALWIKLSDSHLDTGSTEAAEQHARKAIALAEDDLGLTRQAWLQLAKVLDALGQSSAARSIQQRYGRARG
jgi:tetratricopeptide (TPR) repeat protein